MTGHARDVEPADQVSPALHSPGDVQDLLRGTGYLADVGLSTAVYLALSLDQPLLLEGEAGVGKTDLAKGIAACLGRRLVRLQCYEGIDATQALYEWDYSRQLLYLRALSESDPRGERLVEDVFGSRFLVERPILTAVRAGREAVLLVDEIDRADDEFEAFLLEVLSDFQVTIPELGTIRAEQPPFVVMTSNRTRELHDALKRRCMYHWIDYPDLEREVEIVRVRAPEVPESLTRHVVRAVERMRVLDLVKVPGVAETINWARALAYLGADELERDTVEATFGSVLKDRDDLALVRGSLDEILARD